MIVHMKKPLRESSDVEQVVSEFAVDLWAASLVTFVVCTVLLMITYYFGLQLNGDRELAAYGLNDAWLCTVETVCQKAHNGTPKTWACRLVFVTGHLTALVLFIAYAAVFVSFLAVRRFNLPFTDFRGFLHDGSYALGVIRNSEREAVFKNSGGLLKQIYDKLIEPHGNRPPKSDNEGLQRVCAQDHYSYLCTQITLRGLAKSLPCVIVEVPQAYFSTTVSMIMQKGSPYKRILSHHLQEMKRTGILNRIDLRIWPKEYEDAAMMTDPPAVSLHTVSVIFAILSAGVVVSISVLLVEMVLHRLAHNNRITPLHSKWNSAVTQDSNNPKKYWHTLLRGMSDK